MQKEKNYGKKISGNFITGQQPAVRLWDRMLFQKCV